MPVYAMTLKKRHIGQEVGTENLRGLILSLLLDHCLLLHPQQTTRIENQLPAYTAQCLQRLAQMDALLEFISSKII